MRYDTHTHTHTHTHIYIYIYIYIYVCVCVCVCVVRQLRVNMGPIDYPETSVRNCHYILRNVLEERVFHVLLI